jgi:serine/threonine protein kinase
MRQTERLDRQFAKYQLVHRIADGRMGEVFKAKSKGVEGFEKILCVKILYPRLVREEAFVETVIEEAKRSVSLSHANVAQVLDLGQDDDSGRYYIASEHINGLDLGKARTRAAEAGRQWPRDLSVFIASEAAKALDYAHRRKDFNFNNLDLLHGDVCPNNVLISFDGEVKLTDFGLSRAFDTLPVSREDNPDRRYMYAPPEHARGAEYSRASDIFGLGLVTYEMLTGAHPYLDDGQPMRQSATQAEFPPIDDVLDVSGDLASILNAMLERDPDARIDNAGTVYERLVEFLYEQDLRSDNRSLAQLMSELREVGSESEPQPTSGEASDLDQISHADVQSFYERSEVELRSGEPSDGLPEMPGGLDASFERAKKGRGQAVLMSGQFGLGRRYLPDRLADVLANQARTRNIVLHRSEDDRLRPWGLIADLIETLIDPESDHGIQSSINPSSLSLIDSLGSSDTVVRLLAELWGLEQFRGYDELLSPEQSLDEQVNDLLQRWMRRIDQDDETVVIVVDRIERTDRRSLRIIRRMLDWIEQHSILLVMSTKAEESIRQTFDVGEPDALRAVQVGASEVTSRGDIPELDADARRLLGTLSMLERPIRRSGLQSILGIDATRIESAAETLLDHGFARAPHSDSLLSAARDAEVSLDNHLSPEQLQRLRQRIIGFLENCAPGTSRTYSVTALIRLRLHAMARNRTCFRAEAERYEEWLNRFGWESVAADLYKRLSQTLSLFPLGDPRVHLESLARATHYALELGELSRARQSLDPLAARAERSSFNSLAHLLRGRTHLIEDDLQEADRTLHRAAELADRCRAQRLLPRTALALAQLARRSGDLRVAHRRLGQANNLADRLGIPLTPDTLSTEVTALAPTPHQPLTSAWYALFLDEQARFHLDSGQLRAAHDTASELAAFADIHPTPAVRLRSDMVDGLLFRHGDQARTANHRFDRVAQRARDLELAPLAADSVFQQAILAWQTNQFSFLASRADTLREDARRIGAVFLEQRAREFQALAHIFQDHDPNESLQLLRDGLDRASHRSIPRDIIRCHRYLARALEHLEEPGAERHRSLARRIANRWQFA